MQSLKLERGKVTKSKKCNYIVRARDKFYLFFGEMPQYETALAQDFLNWLEDTSHVTPLEELGLTIAITNKEIEFSQNLTDLAEKYNVDLDTLSKLRLVEALPKHSKTTNDDYYETYKNLEWFFQTLSRTRE